MRLITFLSAACIFTGIGRAQPVALKEPASVSGRVLDTYSGLPVQGAMVYIIEVKTNSAVPLNDSALTDSAGKYRFSNLVPIEETGSGYVLLVKLQRYAYTQSYHFNVASGQDLIRDLNLERILSVSLLVRSSSDNAVTLSGAHVTLFPLGGKLPTRSVETNAQGRAGFTDLAAGYVMLSIAMKGYLTVVMSREMDRMVWDDTVQVAMRKDTAGENRSLQGVMKTTSGTPIWGFRFFFHCQDTAGTAYLYTTSAQDGRFRFDGIPGVCANGTYSLNEDSASVTLTGRTTEADFILNHSPGLEVRPASAAPAKTPSWTRWFRDFNVLGRKRR